ncbi:MAG: hypothetical protein ACR2P9_00930 [Gammaproteobacteria bacterium]
MKVKSKLADIVFQFGNFEYRKDHLIVHSAPGQSMQTTVYISPDDIVAGLKNALSQPMVWLYIIAFPFFLIRYRRRKAAQVKP